LHARIDAAYSWRALRDLFEQQEGYVTHRHVLLLLGRLGHLAHKAPTAAAAAAAVPVGRDEEAAYQELVNTLVSLISLPWRHTGY
jgi:hypothetical protein